MKLKRIQAGVFETLDKKFRLRHLDYCGFWYIYEASPYPEDDGFYDEPSFGIRFKTKKEACEYLEDYKL